jgi:hypothetical protein
MRRAILITLAATGWAARRRQRARPAGTGRTGHQQRRPGGPAGQALVCCPAVSPLPWHRRTWFDARRQALAARSAGQRPRAVSQCPSRLCAQRRRRGQAV